MTGDQSYSLKFLQIRSLSDGTRVEILAMYSANFGSTHSVIYSVISDPMSTTVGDS